VKKPLFSSEAARHVALEHIAFLETLNPAVHLNTDHPVYQEQAERAFRATDWKTQNDRASTLLRFAGYDEPLFTGKSPRPGQEGFKDAFIKHYAAALGTFCSDSLKERLKKP
jgi:hypothetical protein